MVVLYEFALNPWTSEARPRGLKPILTFIDFVFWIGALDKGWIKEVEATQNTTQNVIGKSQRFDLPTMNTCPTNPKNQNKTQIKIMCHRINPLLIFAVSTEANFFQTLIVKRYSFFWCILWNEVKVLFYSLFLE